MSAVVQEWLNLIVRWVHVVAGIMWIGDSFLFMWLDSHLSKPTKIREGDVVGELWMTHSGGFYEVIKRKTLAASDMPDPLYWFKWESYTTWLSGFLLLVIVYHLNGAALLIDPTVRALSAGQAVHISLVLLIAGYAVYELLWLTPLAKSQAAFGAVALALLTATAFGLTHVFSARGAFLQVGAMIGTVMAANVFFRIIPAQKHMLAMTKAGQPVDASYGLRAKGRSVQNHYATLPVLFTMLSNHFPSLYGNRAPWAVLGLLFVFGFGLKYAMNKRTSTPAPALGMTVAALAGAFYLAKPVSLVDEFKSRYEGEPVVGFAQVQAIVATRCASCHAARPSSPMFAAPPVGVVLESKDDFRKHAERMFLRSVATETMPLGNLTGMTAEERKTLGIWFAQGADVEAKGATPASDVSSEAQAMFTAVCATCHGAQGLGDGPAAAALTPAPRNLADAAWQASVDDAHLSKVILEGGPSVGKSPLMPSNPSLADKPAVLEGLVRMIRGFGKAP